MTIRRRSARRRVRCADQTPTCAERDAEPIADDVRPIGSAERLARLLATWPGTLRLVLVLAVAVGLLAGVMLVAPVEINLGPVQIAPAAPGR